MKDNTRAIILIMDGRSKRVSFDDYVRAKLKSLRDFGYPNLTLGEVIQQANKILAGKRDLKIIGMMMEGEIAPVQEKP